MSPNHAHFLFSPGPPSHHWDPTKTRQVQFLFPMYSLKHRSIPSGQLFKDNLDLSHPLPEANSCKGLYFSIFTIIFKDSLQLFTFYTVYFFLWDLGEVVTEGFHFSHSQLWVIDTTATAFLPIADSSCMNHRLPHSLWWHHGPRTS